MNNEVVQINDVPAVTDSLGMDTRYKGIANFIQNCSTPMTLAIQGDWGTGKTSAMELIRKEISKNLGGIEVDHFSIWFNTWQFSVFNDGEKLIIDLLHMLLRSFKKLAENAGIEDNTKKENLISRIDTTMDLVTRATFCAGKAVVKQISPLADFFVELVGDLKNPGESSACSKPEAPVTSYVTELRDKINTLLSEILKVSKLQRIYVFVDDLDRLEPRIALELLEGMKNFADYENCVFILAVDQDVVERGLRSKYGDDLSRDKARKFFDKIIQVPFALPVQAYDIETYITPLLKGEKEFLDLYVNLLTKFEVRNPRTIKRSFNLLQLYKCIELATSPGGNMILTTEMSLKRYAVLLLQLEFPDIHEQMTHSAVNCDAQEMYQEFVECLQDDSDNSDILVNGLTAVLQLFYGQDFDPDAENADAAKTEELAKILIETQEMLVPPEERQEIQRLPYAEFLKSLCEHLKDKVSIENTDVWNAVAAADSEQLALDKRSVELRGWGENNIPFTLTWNDRKPSPNLTVYAPLDAAQMFKGMENCFYNILEEKNKKKRGNLGYYHHGGERPRITLVLNLGKHTLAYTLQFLKNCGIIAE